MSNYIQCKVWYEITYPFPDVNSATDEVWEWILIIESHTLLDVWLFLYVGIKVQPCSKRGPCTLHIDISFHNRKTMNEVTDLKFILNHSEWDDTFIGRWKLCNMYFTRNFIWLLIHIYTLRQNTVQNTNSLNYANPVCCVASVCHQVRCM